MAKQVELNKRKGKATSQGENRPVWNNVQRLNHQNKFVPKAVLTKTGIFLVNATRQNPSSQAAETSTARKVNANMAGWKPKDLKSKSFANIQELFDKAFKRVNTFIDFRTELVEGTKMEESSKKAEVMEESSKKAEIAQESSSKRVEDELEQENAKKQKVDDDQEAAKMKELMKIIPNEEEVAVDVIPLTTKPQALLIGRFFDMEDLETLWKLVKAKHGYTRPEEGYEIVLWGDLKIMFEHHAEDAVWRNLR
ncbi:hypothetical protein Tco_0020762 [Tanacetum coccineum]